jgi:hypothetical protein
MNKEFVKKMIQAKQFEYEAIKEILPDNLRKKVDTMESDAIELMKEVAFDFLKDYVKGDFNRADEGKDTTTGNYHNAYKDKDGAKCSSDCSDKKGERARSNPYCADEDRDGTRCNSDRAVIDEERAKSTCKSVDKNNDKSTSNSSNSDKYNEKKKSSRKINVDFM